MVMPVGFVKKSAVLLLTLFWVFASNHCALEQVTELGFLACGSGKTAPPHQDTDCTTDDCAIVEGQPYKAERTSVSAAAPALLVAALLGLAADWSLVPPNAANIPPDTGPPDSRGGWRFSQRAALSPRAPSFAS